MQKIFIGVLIVLMFIIMPIACAEVVTVEADGYYTVGDGPEENISVAKERARIEAKRIVTEQAGIYVESISEVKNGKLTRDEIRTISSAVLQVQSENITPEILSGSVIQFHCHITTLVDTANILKQLKDKENLIEATQRNKLLEEENARIKAELATLKEQYKSADAVKRQEINAKVRLNELRTMMKMPSTFGFRGGRYAVFAQTRIYYETRVHFNEVLGKEKEAAAEWNNLGYIYYIETHACETLSGSRSSDDYQSAADAFSKAAELDPSNEEYKKKRDIALEAVELAKKLGEPFTYKFNPTKFNELG